MVCWSLWIPAKHPSLRLPTTTIIMEIMLLYQMQCPAWQPCLICMELRVTCHTWWQEPLHSCHLPTQCMPWQLQQLRLLLTIIISILLCLRWLCQRLLPWIHFVCPILWSVQWHEMKEILTGIKKRKCNNHLFKWEKKEGRINDTSQSVNLSCNDVYDVLSFTLVYISFLTSSSSSSHPSSSPRFVCTLRVVWDCILLLLFI